MESFWNAFSISFLLRSLFSGSFFIISFYYTYYKQYKQCPFDLTSLKDSIGVIIIISLLAGSIMYAFHRALPYALILEPFINGNIGNKIRRKKWAKKYHGTLITINTMIYLLKVWDMDSDNKEPNKTNNRSKKKCIHGEIIPIFIMPPRGAY